jgi:hypothetical protein
MITIKHCIHGVPMQGKDKRTCWCTFRVGNQGLVNGQRVEFESDKIKRFIPHKEGMRWTGKL